MASSSDQSHSPDPARSTAAKKAAATRRRNAAQEARSSVSADARLLATDAREGGATVTADVQHVTDDAREAIRATAQASEAEAKVRAAQMRHLAERTVDLPVGVGLVARDTIVSSVRGLATTLGDRTRLEHELARYESRGASARNRFGREVERTRTNFERGVRERGSRVTRLVGRAQSRIGSTAR